jgi:uncharacterized membrane protein
MERLSKGPAIVALVASLLGLTFGGYSTSDYAQHLDRQLHDIHCSFIPGAALVSDAENACRVAMYSPYSALLRERWWGGVPVSVFALGVYGFFAAFALALLIGGSRVSWRAWQFFGVAGLSPLVVSVVMAFLSAVKLHAFCKTCMGLYFASALLAGASVWGMLAARRFFLMQSYVATAPTPLADSVAPAASPDPPVMPLGHPALFAVWLAAMGASTVLPAVVYVSALPDYRPKLATCGKLPEPSNKIPLALATLHPKRDALLFADPLCPTCKALHERLAAEDVIENLKLSLVLMPLDNACNWMLDRPMHPGACLLSRAVLCAEPRSREALEWMYANQEELAALGKAGDSLLRARVRTQFGNTIDACLDAKQTQVRLNNQLQFAVANQVPVSTPQLYLGDMRVCDEDTDLGLRYTLGQLAPEVLR